MNACLGKFSKDPSLIEAYKERRKVEIAAAKAALDATNAAAAAEAKAKAASST
jgi:hypothetical protein